MKVIVSQRIKFYKEIKEVRDCIDQSLINWLLKFQYLPFLIPNTLYKNKNDARIFINWLNHISPDFIILSGGNDVGEFKSRDNTENKLLKWAIDKKKPVLGICRGMQIMGIYFDGNLKKLKGHLKTKHKLISNYQDFDQRVVKSYHNYGFDDCPTCFNKVAVSPDNTVEAIRHKTLPLEGWMWHPEREKNNHIDYHRLEILLNGK